MVWRIWSEGRHGDDDAVEVASRLEGAVADPWETGLDRRPDGDEVAGRVRVDVDERVDVVPAGRERAHERRVDHERERPVIGAEGERERVPGEAPRRRDRAASWCSVTWYANGRVSTARRPLAVSSTSPSAAIRALSTPASSSRT